jgi:hypothetical protein
MTWIRARTAFRCDGLDGEQYTEAHADVIRPGEWYEGRLDTLPGAIGAGRGEADFWRRACAPCALERRVRRTRRP